MLISHLDLLATAPGGVARLRELILTLAVQGKLVPQDPKDEPANELLKKIREEKGKLITEGKIKQDKPLAEIAEEEKPFGLPRGWEWVRLGSVAEANTGFAFKSTQYASAGTLVFRVTNIRPDGSVDLSDSKFIDPISASTTYKSFSLHAGDVLLVMVGGSLGKIGIVDASCLPAVLNQNMWKMVINGCIHREYFVHCLRYVNKHQLKVTNSTHGHLAQGEYLHQPVALPPLAEQSRIVTRVAELMRLCDALEAKGQLDATQHAQLVSTLLGTLTESETPEELAENWQRIATHFDLLLDRPEAVDALEQTILQLAVRGLLVPQNPQDEPASQLLKKIRAEKDKLIAEGKIKRDKPLPPIAEEENPFNLPTGWEWVRVGNIGVTQTGGTPASSKPEYFDGNFPFIGPGQITLAGNILLPEKFISDRGRLESAVAEMGDILMVCIGGSIGKCASASYTTAFNQQINSIHPILASNEYVLNAMTAREFTAEVLSAATGSATPIISKGKWDLLLLPVPPLAEQSRIVTRVAQLRRLCNELRHRLVAASERQSQLAQSLVEKQCA